MAQRSPQAGVAFPRFPHRPTPPPPADMRPCGSRPAAPPARPSPRHGGASAPPGSAGRPRSSNMKVPAPGCVPTDLPETYALKLLTKASDTVRVFKPVVPEDLQPGTTISWQSPLFGRVQGEVAMLPEGGWLVVRCHSVTGDLALVKLDWHIRIEGNAKND